MTDATNPSLHAPSDVVRARRFELLDDLGEVRAVLGNIARETDADYWPGLTVRDAYGRERLRILIHDMGPDIEFDMAGNTALVLGVHDLDSAAAAPGPHLTLCAPDGSPVIGWRVNLDGTWERMDSPR